MELPVCSKTIFVFDLAAKIWYVHFICTYAYIVNGRALTNKHINLIFHMKRQRSRSVLCREGSFWKELKGLISLKMAPQCTANRCQFELAFSGGGNPRYAVLVNTKIIFLDHSLHSEVFWDRIMICTAWLDFSIKL